MIPRKIVQYWNDDTPPSEVSALMDTWRDLNKSYEYERFDFLSAKKFISKYYGHEICDFFSNLQFPSMQSDVFRVAYLNIFGGIYVDAASKCKASIHDMIDKEKVTIVRKWHGRVCNGFISSPENSEYIKKIWAKIVDNIRFCKGEDVWSVTGPKLFIDNYFSEMCYAIEQKNAESFFVFINDLGYKVEHWSKLQDILPLYKNDFVNIIRKVVPCYYLSKLQSKELIIHVGQHKTGSTSIQRELISLEKNEAENDVLYPCSGRAYAGHHALASILGSSEKKWMPVIENLILEVSSSKKSKIILSSEFFSSFNEIEYRKKALLKC